MWNMVENLMKREHGLSSNDFYDSQFILEKMEITYTKSRHDHLNFNRNGDLLCSGDFTEVFVLDTAQRQEAFRFCTDALIRDFCFLNNLNSEGGVEIVTSHDGEVQIHKMSSEGTSRSTQKILLPTEKGLELTLCPKQETQLFCTDRSNRIFRIDLRAEPAAVESNHYEFLRFYNLIHDPVKTELCTYGIDSYVRIFDTRKLKTPLKEYEIDFVNDGLNTVDENDLDDILSSIWEAFSIVPFENVNKNVDKPIITDCSYNFDGSEILITDKKQQMHLIYNDHSNKATHKFDCSSELWTPQFFGAKSEFLVSISKDHRLVFKNKLHYQYSSIISLPMMGAFSTMKPEIHPKKPIIVAGITTQFFNKKMLFCAPKGTYDSTDEDDENWLETLDI